MHKRYGWTHWLALIVLAAVAAACDRDPQQSADDRPAAQPEARSPSWVTTKIQAQYFADPDIKPWNIDVTTTTGGRVTLRGEVETAADRETAVRIARQTEGVAEVEDLLQVRGEAVATTGGSGKPDTADPAARERLERPDLWITTKIQAKYFTDDEVRATSVDVDTRGGVVTLSGVVDSYAARRQAVALARNTEGVREVRDELRIASAAEDGSRQVASGDTESAIDDAWIETKIQAKYFLDPEVKGRNIDVAVAEGVVTLTGQVDTDAHKTTAEQIAGETEGVTEVRNELQVARSQQ